MEDSYLDQVIAIAKFGLSPDAYKLLQKLVDDYSSTFPKEQRMFKPEASAAYIWNLFNGKYNFSFEAHKEVFEFLKQNRKSNV